MRAFGNGRRRQVIQNDNVNNRMGSPCNNRASIMQTNTFNKLQRGRAVHPIHSEETVKNSDIDDRARCGYVCHLQRLIGVELLTQTLRPTHRYHRNCISHHTRERQGLGDARLTFRRANVLPQEQADARSQGVKVGVSCRLGWD